jgi:toxin ParE1/3/4
VKFRVVSMPDAEAEIAAAFLWIHRQAPLEAVRWMHGLEDAIDSLREFPARCRVAAESVAFDREVRQLVFKSHRILFVIEGGTVFVLHVRHVAMMPALPDPPTRN